MSGRHLAFPFRIGNDGRSAAPGSIDEHVKGEVIQLLLTNPGERPFIPEFGGGIRRMVFEGNSDYNASIAKATITNAVSYWLSERVTLLELVVSNQDSTLLVDLRYQILSSGEEHRLCFEHSG